MLVVEPRSPVLVGRARLDRLRETADGSGAIDDQMIREVKIHAPDILVFSRGADGSLWRFDHELSDAEYDELGFHLVRTQLPTWRRFALSGVVSYLHVGWSTREVLALENGKRRLLPELSDALDSWIIDTMSTFLVSTLDDVIRDVVPLVARLKQARRARVQQLTA